MAKKGAIADAVAAAVFVCSVCLGDDSYPAKLETHTLSPPCNPLNPHRNRSRLSCSRKKVSGFRFFSATEREKRCVFFLLLCRRPPGTAATDLPPPAPSRVPCSRFLLIALVRAMSGSRCEASLVRGRAASFPSRGGNPAGRICRLFLLGSRLLFCSPSLCFRGRRRRLGGQLGERFGAPPAQKGSVF